VAVVVAAAKLDEMASERGKNNWNFTGICGLYIRVLASSASFLPFFHSEVTRLTVSSNDAEGVNNYLQSAQGFPHHRA
jgi:hypothetical protein